MQLHMWAVKQYQVHTKARGGVAISKRKDTLANQKPEEK